MTYEKSVVRNYDSYASMSHLVFIFMSVFICTWSLAQDKQLRKVQNSNGGDYLHCRVAAALVTMM